jgi:hypothetical protein
VVSITDPVGSVDEASMKSRNDAKSAGLAARETAG